METSILSLPPFQSPISPPLFVRIKLKNSPPHFPCLLIVTIFPDLQEVCRKVKIVKLNREEEIYIKKNKDCKRIKWQNIQISGEGYQNSNTEKFRKNTGHLDIKNSALIGPFYSKIFDAFLFMGGGWGLEGGATQFH